MSPLDGVTYLNYTFFIFQAIGAEYGEGFETFRMDGPLKVDVVIHPSEITMFPHLLPLLFTGMFIFLQDYLNDKLQESFLQRIRHAMKPDETYGLIFSWDNVVVITFFLIISFT